MERLKFESSFKEHFVKNDEYSGNLYSLGEDHFRESEKYKQVFSTAETYLIKYDKKLKEEPYHTLKYFNAYVQRSSEQNIVTTWGELASTFFLLCWYASRILRSPWKKSYHKIINYSGNFQHKIASKFPEDVVKSFMERLGFIYHQKQDAFLFHKQSLKTWQESLTNTGMDFFVVHVRCSTISTRIGKSVAVTPIADYPRNRYAEQLTAPTQSSQPWKHRMKNSKVLNRTAPVVDSITSDDDDDLIYEGKETINNLIYYPPKDKYDTTHRNQAVFSGGTSNSRTSNNLNNYVSVRPLPTGACTSSNFTEVPRNVNSEHREKKYLAINNLPKEQWHFNTYGRRNSSHLPKDENYVVVRPPDTGSSNENLRKSRKHIYHEINDDFNKK